MRGEEKDLMREKDDVMFDWTKGLGRKSTFGGKRGGRDLITSDRRSGGRGDDRSDLISGDDMEMEMENQREWWRRERTR